MVACVKVYNLRSLKLSAKNIAVTLFSRTVKTKTIKPNPTGMAAHLHVCFLIDLYNLKVHCGEN